MSMMQQATTFHRQGSSGSKHDVDYGIHPIMICVFGGFRVFKDGRAVAVREGGKTASLLLHLALRYKDSVPRDAIMEAIWPRVDAALASQSLNSLVYSLHKSLSDAIGGASPIVYMDGAYRLNRDSGVNVDVAWFDACVKAGDQDRREGNAASALPFYKQAVEIYRGDLCAGTDVHIVMERERLRAIYLTLLVRLAAANFSTGDYGACLEYARQVLAHDPCREDAHRLVMQCSVRQGERAQALRQYRICEGILHREFEAMPEPATTMLFEQIRRDPGSV
jgi:DNA-binding SARP family transcriptional activator